MNVHPIYGTAESIVIIGSITDLSKNPMIWFITEYGRAIASISEIIVYQNILLLSLFRQWGCQNFHGRLNMTLRILLSFQTIGEPQVGQAFHPGCRVVPQEQTLGRLFLDSPPEPSTAFWAVCCFSISCITSGERAPC